MKRRIENASNVYVTEADVNTLENAVAWALDVSEEELQASLSEAVQYLALAPLAPCSNLGDSEAQNRMAGEALLSK